MKKVKHKLKVDTLIVSDIHLGFGMSRVDKLFETIKKYRFGRIILNGDIFDSLNFNRLHTEHWGVLSRIRELSKKCEVIWVIGNHDGDIDALSQLLGVKIYSNYSWKIGDKRAVAIHGHQFDRFLHKNIIISAIAISLYHIVQRFDTKNNLVSRWLRERSKSYLRLSEEVAKGAIWYAKLKDADYIFCGHTHLAKIKKSGNIRYYNSGCWTSVPSSYITINGENVEVVDVY